MATKYASLTPYNYSFNDPVTFTDVSGADPWDFGPYAGNSAYYYAMQGQDGMSPGQESLMDPFGGGWNPARAGGYGNNDRYKKKLFGGTSSFVPNANFDKSERFLGWYFSRDHATEAFRFMQENSFETRTRRNGRTYRVAVRELAAWITNDGILVQPWEGPRVDKDGNVTKGWERNGRNEEGLFSKNNYLPFDRTNMKVLFSGTWYSIVGQIHTHPEWGPSDTTKDAALLISLGIPIYNIYGLDIFHTNGAQVGTVATPSKDLFIK